MNRHPEPLLLIDLDHTLVERDGGADAWTPAFCTTHGLPADAAPTVFALFRADPSPAGFTRIAAHYGLTHTGRALWNAHVAHEAARTHLLPGVPDALATLREAGWTIGVVTNGHTDIQRAKLARTGLLPAVDAVCVSEEAGARKPAPEIFHLAAARLGRTLTPADWMVGNNPATDICGAHATGLRSIWITPAPPPPLPPSHPVPTHTAPDTPAAATLLLATR
ncbi:HAD family hydrolase [Kitasatospora sp. RG8]|uniref:HAD family hydrolase n=1 Tax=Kitasatospora sp. RG8 TaxID=2820815 RepID=UPI001AE0664C|nr:HAD family hydrolase [Kitasatospora sp. RG8]MBP0452404.1 HAD family hydrolase [Kitasatospora sp. RG8]